MKPEVKKLILSNLPYLIFIYLFGKLGQAYRLAAGVDLSEKLLHFMDGCSAAFVNAAPSIHPFDLLIGVAGAAALRLMVYFKGKNAKKYRKGAEYGSARWCADQCGYIDRSICPKFSLCSDGVNWFQQRNQWLAGTETPSPGMIIFFDWADNGQDGVSDHVGIVASVENGTVHTIEGNSGDACRERSYSVGYYEILGYGVLQVGGETDNSNTETPTQ